MKQEKEIKKENGKEKIKEAKQKIDPVCIEEDKSLNISEIVNNYAEDSITEFAERLDLKENNILASLEISQNEEEHLEIPYHNKAGQIIDIKEMLDTENFKWKKCISPSVYGLNLSKNYNKEKLVITADESTCIALVANNTQAIAICGNSISQEAAEEIEKYSNVYVLIDNTEKAKELYNNVFDNIRIKNANVIYSSTYGYNSFLEMHKKSKKELDIILGKSQIEKLNLNAKNLEAYEIRRYINKKSSF